MQPNECRGQDPAMHRKYRWSFLYECSAFSVIYRGHKEDHWTGHHPADLPQNIWHASKVFFTPWNFPGRWVHFLQQTAFGQSGPNLAKLLLERSNMYWHVQHLCTSGWPPASSHEQLYQSWPLSKKIWSMSVLGICQALLGSSGDDPMREDPGAGKILPTLKEGTEVSFAMARRSPIKFHLAVVFDDHVSTMQTERCAKHNRTYHDSLSWGCPAEDTLGDGDIQVWTANSKRRSRSLQKMNWRGAATSRCCSPGGGLQGISCTYLIVKDQQPCRTPPPPAWALGQACVMGQINCWRWGGALAAALSLYLLVVVRNPTSREVQVVACRPWFNRPWKLAGRRSDVRRLCRQYA